MIKCESWQKYVEKFNRNDEELISQMISNEGALAWMGKEVPKFECPDKTIEETYYFRWWTFRKHIKEIPGGRIITEFLPNVYWAGAYNSINAANCHHFAEARWLAEDKDLIKEYFLFWLKGEGNETSYSSWFVYSMYQYALLTGEKEFTISLFSELRAYYQKVEASNFTKYGLFWSYDDRDAMEMSISGSGLRPTLNSYMYANAYALARIAAWADYQEMQAEYEKIAHKLKEKILALLWDETDDFFKVIPQEAKDKEINSLHFEDIPLAHNVREAIGYIPWNFKIADEKYDRAWKYLLDKRYFKATYGPTTAERNHPLFMKMCETHECLWNGPSWPFATTQTLNGLIEMLQQGREEYINRKDFLELMQIYSKSHYRENAQGEQINWIDENLDPDSGQWLSRRILKEWNWREDKGGYERGKDYNHSTFCDLVIRGLCGVQIDESDYLNVNPLIPADEWEYFWLENLPYQGHLVTIGYDQKGIRYNRGKGFFVEVDQERKITSDRLEKVRIKI